MDLNVIEKFLILTKHPARARFLVSNLHLKYGIAGAILLEMSVKETIEIKNNYLKIIRKPEWSENEYPVLKEISEMIANFGKEKRIRFWIKKLSWKYRKFKWIFIQGLTKKHYFKVEQKSFLGIPYKSVYLLNSNARNNLIFHLRDIVLYKKKKNEKDLAILGLIEACKMYKVLSKNRHERKTIRQELKKMIKEEPISQVVDSTIKQVQVAITVAIATSVAASSAAR